MELTINILMPFITMLFGYLIGSIPTSIIIGKIIFKQDPREYGSKNPGGTNSGRIWGKKYGALVIVLDIIKSIIAFWIVYTVLTFTSLHSILNFDSYAVSLWITTFATVFGHCYPIFAQFRGGKGVATFVGCYGTTSILQFACGLIVFIGTLFKTKIVSLSSICLSISGVIISLITYFVCNYTDNTVFIFLTTFGILPMHYIYPITIILSSALLIYRHKGNIIRIINGNENRTKLFSKVKK